MMPSLPLSTPAGSGPPEDLDPARFRQAMRAVAGAVTVITCGEEGARTGMTATAMCSLTDAPPSLLVCVNGSASAHPVIRRTGRFAVNVLSEGHIDLAARFAGRGGVAGEARFAEARWTREVQGSPMLEDAEASFDCVLEAEHRHGSHSIFVGRVVGTRLAGTAAPLIYRGGVFGAFTELLVAR